MYLQSEDFVHRLFVVVVALALQGVASCQAVPTSDHKSSHSSDAYRSQETTQAVSSATSIDSEADSPSRTVKGISLHIGLERVDPLHYGSPNELNSPGMDAKMMDGVAEAQGFEKRTVLLNKEATRKRVKEEIRAAAAALKSGDFFLLTYSGHGGQVPDRTGDENGDKMDETWCLWDGQILDDELHEEWLRFEKGVRVLVVSDSCHSGDMLKAMLVVLHRMGDKARSDFLKEALPDEDTWRSFDAALKVRIPGDLQPKARSRIKALSTATALRVYFSHHEYYDEIIRGLHSRKAAEKRVLASVRLLAACGSKQKALDGGTPQENSLFTQELLRVWDNGHFDGNYDVFVKKIGEFMPAEHTPQQDYLGTPDPGYDAQKPFTL